MRLLVNHGHLSIPRFPLEMLLRDLKITQGKKDQRQTVAKRQQKSGKEKASERSNPVSNRLPLELSYVMGPQLHSERGDVCAVHTGARRHVSLPYLAHPSPSPSMDQRVRCIMPQMNIYRG